METIVLTIPRNAGCDNLKSKELTGIKSKLSTILLLVNDYLYVWEHQHDLLMLKIPYNYEDVAREAASIM